MLLFFPLLLQSCKTEKESDAENEYLRWVGDIKHSEEKDRPDFRICNGEEQVLQYFNLGAGPIFPEEKSTLLETFETQYKPVEASDQNGLIRIRFVVNCEGKAGRFRLLQVDNDYNEIEFDKRITDQLLEITKGIKVWKVMYRREIPVDYYFYLIFKMKDGHLTEILP